MKADRKADWTPPDAVAVKAQGVNVESGTLDADGIAGKLESLTGRSHQKEIANFCCELAINEMMHSRPDAARPFLAEALAHHRLCVRANMLLGDIEAAGGAVDKAATDTKKKM